MRATEIEILLAGTRITGVQLHLGTYLGWLRQIECANRKINCIIMLCDLQSLDCNTNQNDILELKRNIKKILPQIPVIIESEIENIGALALYISSFMNRGLSNRISTFRKLTKTNPSIPLNVFLYPSLMLANLLSVNATHMFDKPEGRFQHIEIINGLVRRINSKNDVKINSLKKWRKNLVDIPKLSGSGAMKRESSVSSDMILVDDNLEIITNKLMTSVKEISFDENRYQSCKTVFPILKSVQQFYNEINLENECRLNKISCTNCIKRLSELIYADINQKRDNSTEAENIELQWKKFANQNVDKWLKIYLNK